MWFRGLRFLRKSGSLFGKSCLVGLTLLIGLLGLFVACFVGRRRKTLIIFFGIASTSRLCGVLFYGNLVLAMSAFKAFV